MKIKPEELNFLKINGLEVNTSNGDRYLRLPFWYKIVDEEKCIVKEINEKEIPDDLSEAINDSANWFVSYEFKSNNGLYKGFGNIVLNLTGFPESFYDITMFKDKILVALSKKNPELSDISVVVLNFIKMG